ncbi:hypothetical protein IQ07DRAFT_584085 [Pyrenochaeta sp. DS3sAY3a]|nr:hypothetical protein IQ07DRAFT_584085 [Pyrenochaeta sp. DS3sAY3a]
MVVCQFYQRGNCKFGDSCYKEHPGSQRDANRNPGSGSSAFGGASNNRFSAFGGGDRYRPGQASDSKPSYNLDKNDIRNDLTGQRPIYPLSSYGPGKDAPRQLIEGPVDISPEELRLRYYTLRAAGNEGGAQQEETALNEKMQQQVKAIVDDIDGAIRYIEEGANVHPNRIDIAKGNVAPGASGGSAAASSASSSNPFLKVPQSSALGQASSPGFGRPAFGQPSNPAQTTSAFGQPSNPGQTTSAFGQPSNPGQTTSAFGQPSNPGQTTSAFGQTSNPGQTASPFGTASSLGPKPSPFGQPSALAGAGGFGKPAFGASGFGQPSLPGSGSAFGQTSSMGQGSAFGQPSAPGTTSGFGQASALGQKPNAFSNPGFGQSGFGKPAVPNTSASPFSQAQSGPSPFGQQAPSTQSPFGQQAQQGSQPSPFGQQSQQPANPFQQGQQPAASSSPFGGGAASQPSAFGQTSQPAASASPFATQPQNATSQAANPFLTRTQVQSPSSATSTTQSSTQASLASPFGQPQQPSTTFGQQTQSPAPASGTVDPKDRFKEGKPEEYEGEQGKLLEEIYRRVGQLGRFDDNEDIPITPPKCEWIVPMTI